MSFLSHSVGLVACVCFLVVHGCGGGVTTEDDGSSSVTGAGAGTGSASSGATSNAASSSASSAGGGASCENVPEYINNLYGAAAECSPADPSLHCQDIVDGYCCPVVVESISSPATQAYLDFLELTKEQCPELWAKCAVVDCVFPEPGNCVPDGSPAGEGHCSNG